MFQTRKFTKTIKNVFEATMSTINDNIESLPAYFLFSLFCPYMVILKKHKHLNQKQNNIETHNNFLSTLPVPVF